MCPTNNPDITSVGSDRSIDQERQGSIASIPCADAFGNALGYRADATEGGACEALRIFSKRVNESDIYIGDCDRKTKIIDRIAGGSFGEVYRGEIEEEKKYVAVKIESQGPGSNFLLQEGAVYRNLEGGPGIPMVYWFGFHGSCYGAMVMDLLGPSLDELLSHCKRKFSLKTVLLLVDQMIDILAHVHSQGFVHRDISPSNFVMGIEGAEDKVFLIDFGHAKRFRNSFQVVPRRNSLSKPRAVVGTPRFIGVHAHMSHEESPRDDLESLGYIFIYLLRGMLPWQGLRAQHIQEKLNKIAEIKMNTPLEKLCKDVPEEFAVYLNYVRSLKMLEPADYEGIKQLFRNLADKMDISYDGQFDWMEKDSRESTGDQQGSDSIPIEQSNADSNDESSPNTTPISR